MIYIFGLSIILVIVFMVGSYKKKKKIADLIKEFNNNWGKPKFEKYRPFNLIEKYFRNNKHQEEAF